MTTPLSYTLDARHAALKRLDKALSACTGEAYSRARLQALIQQGCVQVNATVQVNASAKVKEGDVIVMEEPPPAESTPQPENIPLTIVYEDGDMLVINKPAGLIVHPGAGNPDGTLVNALLHHCKDSLSGIGGVLRPGIVHRLDKDTSGLMVVAKNDKAHQGLAMQLQDRSLSRLYEALVFKTPMPAKGKVEAAIGRDPRNRLKMAVQGRGGKSAKTFYHVRETFGGACALVDCKLDSGRTHQIRVHMNSIGHPLIGDPLYGPQPNGVQSALKKAGYEEPLIAAVLSFPRQALHAKAIEFIHPISGDHHVYEAALPDDLSALVSALRKASSAG